MKKAIIIILLFLAFTKVDGQVNLVKNPSFEDYYNCPIHAGQLYETKNWWGNSTEYYNSCAISTFYGYSVPLNAFGYQNAHSGISYAGFGIYTYFSSPTNYIEAIKTKLNDTLIANTRYCTKFYISLAEFSYRYSPNNFIFLDSIGILFTRNPIIDSTIPISRNGIIVQNNISNIDTNSWFSISNSFIANGGEHYLTISNFDLNVYLLPNTGGTYLYVDDVSVCECEFKIDFGPDRVLCEGETLLLNPNLKGATYIWQDGSSNSTFLVKEPGNYKVTAYIKEYNIIETDSINITYTDSCFIIPNIITPNGDGYNDYFVITNTDGWNIDLQVYSRWGNIVFQDTDYKNNWDGKSKGNPLADGVYYYIIKTTNQSFGFKKDYKGSVTVLR